MGDLLFLHAFVSVLAPDRVVEIGTLSGFSAAVIADAVAQHQRPESESVLVDTIDLNERCLTDQTKPVGFEIPQLVPASRAGSACMPAKTLAMSNRLHVPENSS